MLLSMTGFGDARRETDRIVISSEVRTVNNRYLKVMVRCSDGYSVLESRIEKLVRETVSRGTVNISLRVDPLRKRERFRVSREVLEDYTRETYSYHQLLDADNLPEGVDRTRLEDYLTDDEFEKVFGMTRVEWNKMPKWRHPDLKRKALLY